MLTQEALPFRASMQVSWTEVKEEDGDGEDEGDDEEKGGEEGAPGRGGEEHRSGGACCIVAEAWGRQEGEEVERELDDDDEAEERRAKPSFDSTCWGWQMSGMLVAKVLSVLGREGWKW